MIYEYLQCTLVQITGAGEAVGVQAGQCAPINLHREVAADAKVDSGGGLPALNAAKLLPLVLHAGERGLLVHADSCGPRSARCVQSSQVKDE